MSKAVFPISINNTLLNTTNVLKALSSINIEYEEVFFMFFDQLQLYNKAIKVSSAYSFNGLITEFNQHQEFFQERRKWIENIKNKLNGQVGNTKWNILNISKIADEKCFTIFRNVLIAFHTIQDFRMDVERAALEYWERKDWDVSEIKLRLSESYILEEIALSIRLRVIEKIEDEYYTGKYLVPLLKIYNSSYGIDVFSLADVEKFDIQFRFFEKIKTQSGLEWKLLENVEASAAAASSFPKF